MILLLCMFPCYTFAQHEYEIYFQSETDETIQLTVVEYDVKKKEATNSACQDAIHALLFNGIDGSRKRRLPFVSDEQSSYDRHSAYFNDLFNNGGYNAFILASTVVEKGKDQNKKPYYVVNVNIHYASLKESLNNHHVIRRFGV